MFANRRVKFIDTFIHRTQSIINGVFFLFRKRTRQNRSVVTRSNVALTGLSRRRVRQRNERRAMTAVRCRVKTGNDDDDTILVERRVVKAKKPPATTDNVFCRGRWETTWTDRANDDRVPRRRRRSDDNGARSPTCLLRSFLFVSRVGAVCGGRAKTERYVSARRYRENETAVAVTTRHGRDGIVPRWGSYYRPRRSSRCWPVVAAAAATVVVVVASAGCRSLRGLRDGGGRRGSSSSLSFARRPRAPPNTSTEPPTPRRRRTTAADADRTRAAFVFAASQTPGGGRSSTVDPREIAVPTRLHNDRRSLRAAPPIAVWRCPCRHAGVVTTPVRWVGILAGTVKPRASGGHAFGCYSPRLAIRHSASVSSVGSRNSSAAEEPIRALACTHRLHRNHFFWTFEPHFSSFR